MTGTVVITGALSYTGSYAARLLLARGYQVRTLTHHEGRTNPLGELIEVLSYNFERPEKLAGSLAGASTLINTYWIRFPRGGVTFDTAVRNSRVLMAAARDAGIGRIVHVSIANPSLESPLGYYRGKAQVEQAVRESGVSYAILRPTLIFGKHDILLNNLAWFCRHLPVFGIPGDGRYAIRPIYVEDMAQLLADSVEDHGNSIVDAVGPETFTFEELVRMVAREVGSSVPIMHMPAWLAYAATLLTGWAVRDVVLTWEEYLGLMGNLLAPKGPAVGTTRLSEWLAANREGVGGQYASEVKRHFLRAQYVPQKAWENTEAS